MALKFCEHEDVVFDDAPLVMVLAQVRFPAIYSLMAKAGVAGFQERLRTEYPGQAEVTQSAAIQIGLGGVGAQTTAPVFKFTDQEKKWTVGIATDFVSLETPSYTNIGDFLDRFDRVLSAMRQTLRPAESVRVGLRKVNVIEIPGYEMNPLRTMLRPELLGMLGVDKYPAPIEGSTAQTSFQEDDNHLVVRYGLGDPEGEERTRFVLDMDYFTERPYVIGQNEALTDVIRHFSDGMTSLFQWAVLPDYAKQLGPRPRQGGTK